MNLCAKCGAPATHFCGACGQWLCDSMTCIAKAGAKAVVTHPVKALQNAPAAVANLADVMADKLFSRP